MIHWLLINNNWRYSIIILYSIGINNGRALYFNTVLCFVVFFLSRTKFPQNATSPLIRNSVPLQHPEQTIPDTTGFQRKLLLFFLKRTVHHSPHPTDSTESTEIIGCFRECPLIGQNFFYGLCLHQELWLLSLVNKCLLRKGFWRDTASFWQVKMAQKNHFYCEMWH